MNKEFDCVEMKKRCKNIAKKISWIKLREELKFWRGRIKGRTENF